MRDLREREHILANLLQAYRSCSRDQDRDRRARALAALAGFASPLTQVGHGTRVASL
jgi:hypothetical protein